MSRMSRDKGLRIERETVALHRSLGLRAEGVPLSGAQRYQGNGADVDVYAFGPDEAPLVCEVKARRDGDGLAVYGGCRRSYGGGLSSARHTAGWWAPWLKRPYPKARLRLSRGLTATWSAATRAA